MFIREIFVERIFRFLFYGDDGSSGDDEEDISGRRDDVQAFCKLLLDSLNVKYESHVALIGLLTDRDNNRAFAQLVRLCGTGQPDCPVKRLSELKNPTAPESIFVELMKTKEEVATLKQELAALKKLVMKNEVVDL